jgi:hypothetical protein
MSRITVKQAAWDRRMAAIHEAGHVVVARSLGIPVASSWIAPNDNHGDQWEKSWTGRTQLGPMQSKCSKRQGRLIGVAGAIAEQFWSDDDDSFWDDDVWRDPEIMSESDWEMAGCRPGQPNKAFFTAIDHVAALLKRDGLLWPSLLQTARALIVEGRSALKSRPRARQGANHDIQGLQSRIDFLRARASRARQMTAQSRKRREAV